MLCRSDSRSEGCPFESDQVHILVKFLLGNLFFKYLTLVSSCVLATPLAKSPPTPPPFLKPETPVQPRILTVATSTYGSSLRVATSTATFSTTTVSLVSAVARTASTFPLPTTTATPTHCLLSPCLPAAYSRQGTEALSLSQFETSSTNASIHGR